MKSLPLRHGLRAAAAWSALAMSHGLQAGSLTANFDDGLPPNGSTTYANTIVETTGGFTGGALKLVKNINGQQGSWVIEDLDAGSPVNSFNATFKARVGGGTTPPADGWSFCFASDLPNGPWGEEGVGSGLSIAFDLYDNAGGEAPAITVRWNNQQIAEVKPGINPLTTGENGSPAWADVQIKLDPDGSLDIVFDGVAHFTNLYTPYTPVSSGRFGFGARTGGLNMNVFIDDLSLTSTTGGLVAAIVHQPQSSTFLNGATARFYSLLANPAVATAYQWERKNPGGTTFAAVPGATTSDFISAAPVTAADHGAVYRLAISDGQGVTFSNEATLTVTTLPEPAYSYTQNFDGGEIPAAQGAIYGSSLIDPTGFVQLTDAANGQSGALLINDLNAGASISSIFASFDLRMGSGTTPPADGFSFNWGQEMTAGAIPESEEGAGNGLRLCFDVYDNADGNPINGLGEAPSLDLKWGTTVLASVRVSPYEFFTDLNFVRVMVSLDQTGKISASFNGRLYFQDVQVPSWTALVNGAFGFYARTGGLNQKHEIDNLAIKTTVYAGPVQITDEVDDLASHAGTAATFVVGANYASPPAAIQWQKRAASESAFTTIPGATAFTLVTPPLTLADHNSQYRAIINVGASSATSREAVLTVVDLTPPANSDVVLTFDSGDLTNTGTASAAVIAARGTAVFTPAGGVNDSGFLSLTEAATSQNGSLVVNNFSGSNAQGALIANFNINLTASGTSIPGVPADGFSLSWGSDVPDDVINTGAEEGAGTGLIITFDVYDNVDANPDNGAGEAPAIGIKYKGAFVTPEKLVSRAFLQPLDWARVAVRVENDGTVDVSFDDSLVFLNVQLPNWTGLANGRFNLAGRTGGAVQTHWIDNVILHTTQYVGPVTLTQQPASIGVLQGTTATFTAQVNDPGQTSWQWQSAPAGATAFTNIPGATTNSHTTAATSLADNGRQYRVLATGLSNTVESTTAVLTVISATLPPPTAQLDFDNASPLAYAFGGSGLLGTGDGVNGSNMAILTTAENGLNGVLVIDDFNAGTPVTSMIASFAVRLGGGTSPPADGMAFVWGNDIGNSTAPTLFGEEGSGNGLIISFDTYANGGSDVPGISLKWQGSLLAEKPMPFSALLSDPDYFPVVIKIDADATADVLFNNEVIFYDVSLPGFSSLSEGNFIWAARTGGLNQNAFIDEIRLFTTTASNPATDALAIAIAGNSLVIVYTGTLQSSTDLSLGSWVTVGGATSPYTMPLPTTGKLFFRTVR